MRSVLAIFLLAGAALLVSATPAGAADSSAANEWQFDGDFYIWASDIDIPLNNGSDVNVDFETILQDLDFMFMGGVGASKGKWSFKTDVIYFRISQDNKGQAAIPGGPRGRLTIDLADSSSVEVQAWVVTPSVGYNLVDTQRVSLDVLGGARYLDLKVDLALEVSASFPRGGPAIGRSVQISPSPAMCGTASGA
jgi:hypothetical protein